MGGEIMKISQLKKEALATLKGTWGIAAVITVVYIFILTALQSTDILFQDSALSFLIMSAVTIFSFILAYGYAIYFLELKRGKKQGVEGLFSGFDTKVFIKIIVTSLLITLYTILWSLLFLIPGIIKSLSYSQYIYILKDNPELSPNEIIKQSQKMMKGRKGFYFLLSLSFIGWFLLGMLTLGIGFFFVLPYMFATYAIFYEKIKDEHDNSLLQEVQTYLKSDHKTQ